MNKILIAAAAVITLGNTATFASTTSSLTPTSEKPQPPMMGIMRRFGMMDNHNHMQGTGGAHQGTGKNNQRMMNDDIKKAIDNNDYNAFVTAFTTMISKRTVPTQTEFTAMVTQVRSMEANKPTDTKGDTLHAAIKANDYTAFIKALEANKPALVNGTSSVATLPVPTQAEFDKIVVMMKLHEAEKNAILANDYNAFVTAFNANKPTIPTQTEFNKMVEMSKTMQTMKGELNNAKGELKDAKNNLQNIKNGGTKTDIKEAKEEVKSAKENIKTAKKNVQSTRKMNRVAKRIIRATN